MVLFLAVVVATGLIPGAECVVRCAEPASTPPCHHAPGKQAPTPRGACDSLMLAGESPVMRSASHGIDNGEPVILPQAAGLTRPAATALLLAWFRQPARPPDGAYNVVLRL